MIPAVTHIVWRDASHGINGEFPIDAIELAELHAVGFILRETADTVVISLEWVDGADTSRNWLAIPKTGILSRHDFRIPKPHIPR